MIRHCWRLAVVLAVCLVIAGCSKPRYDIAISWREPKHSSLQHGITQVVESGLMYQDGRIDVLVTPVLDTAIEFGLRNKSNVTARIIWDDAVFVSPRGLISRVMHRGVRYAERDAHMPPTSVPSGTIIAELIIPSNHVYYVTGSGWRSSSIVPPKDALAYDGRTVGLVLPIEFGPERIEYHFHFTIHVRER